jgi:serine protease Do
MNRKNWTWIIIFCIFLGGMGGILFNKLILPTLASMPALSWLQRLESNNPVIINRSEVVQINEGANFLDLTRQAAAYTVAIYSPSQKFLGNGIITTSDGMILTSKNTMPATGVVTVVLDNGSSYPAALRALDPKSDLAVLTIDAHNLPFAQFADAWNLPASQRLIYLGRSNNAFVHDFALGYVSVPVNNQGNLDRVFDSEVFENNISSDAKLNSDYVGGPVINLDGRVVGLVNSNLGVLVGEDLQTAVTSYIQNGKVVRPSLGIKYLNLSNLLAKIKNLPQGGILVVSVADGTPAKLAGILANDLIISIDNQPLPQGNFEKTLNQHPLSDTPITVLRNSTQVNLTVKLIAK